MGKRFSFKKGQPSITEIGKTKDRIVFGFSELRPYSYVDSHNDSGFFISFLDRLKKLSSIDLEYSQCLCPSFLWLGKDECL